MNVSVVVPFTPGVCEWRDANWAHLRPRWEALRYEVVEGTCDGPWRKSLAVADAIGRASGEILVVADADVWCDHTPDAVDRLAPRSRAMVAVPHGRVRRLTASATDVARATGRLAGELEEPPYRGRYGGGITVIRRSVWDEVPLDPRFVGWGQEDDAWGIALHWHYRSRAVRHGAPLWHLWHPHPPRQTRSIGSDESEALLIRYIRDTARAIAEAREELRR